jgi:hypothetical protein
MADVLRLQTNVPETIALEFTDGLTVSSKFGGDQVMFSLTDGRKLFLTPFVAKKIADSGVQAKQPFVLTKREIASGNRRSVDYQIETAKLVQSSAVPAPSQTTIRQTQVTNAPTPAATPAAAAAPAPAPAPSDTSAVALMKMAGCGAIDVALEVERYAQSKGMTDFLFGAENVQKVAVTLFLEMSRKAGRA